MNALAQSLATSYMTQHPGGAAKVLDGLAVETTAQTLASVGPQVRAGVLLRMNSDAAARSLRELGDQSATEVMLAVDRVRVARWLALLPAHAAKHLRELLPSREQAQLVEALSYPDGCAGYYMDPATIAFRKSTTRDSVFEAVRQREARITDIMVCDEDERLIGVVPLQELIGAEPTAELGTLVHTDRPFVQAITGRDEVVDLLNQHHLATLPVVDVDGRLLGAIRHDALVQAAQQQAGAGLGKMVGAGAEERALSPAVFTVKNRLPWLLINLLTAFAAASVVGLFDATIAKFTALAVLLPVVAGQSGNTGAQALAVTSRGLALREIRAGHWFRVLRKEVAAALVNGVAVAVVTSAGVWVWSHNLGLCSVIGISMIISMVMAAMSGAVIPIILTVLGKDPATASSIILTTVTDIAGFFSFLGLATVMSRYLV